MTYKYFILDPKVSSSIGDIMIDNFQSFVNEQFDNASDVFEILEENVFSSGSYVKTDVRINHGINVYTGEKLGDDFKLLIFKDLNHSLGMGYKYYFDSNYWIVVNTEVLKNLAASCMVRRCNNMLRWVDENSNYFEEPCIIDYQIANPRDQVGAVNPVTPQGMITVICQLNARTRKIKSNQRFIFGNPDNRIGYKVFGDGVKDFLNQKTTDENSAALLELKMGGNFVNPETDDITLGIADKYQNVYTVDVSPTTISGSAGNTLQLAAFVKMNDVATDKAVSYSTSKASVATVSASGLVSLVSTGSAVITCYMTSNATIHTDINTVVSASPIGYDIRITPVPDRILEGATETYLCQLYDSGILQSGSFVFSSGSVVPASSYSLTTISGSAFSVLNTKRYLTAPLTIDCTSGSYTKQISLDLVGAW